MALYSNTDGNTTGWQDRYDPTSSFAVSQSNPYLIIHTGATTSSGYYGSEMYSAQSWGNVYLEFTVPAGGITADMIYAGLRASANNGYYFQHPAGSGNWSAYVDSGYGHSWTVTTNNSCAIQNTTVRISCNGTGDNAVVTITSNGTTVWQGTIVHDNNETDSGTIMFGLGPTYFLSDKLFYTKNITVDSLTVMPNWVATYPKVGSKSFSEIKLLVEADENCNAYFVCLPSGATAPTSAQVEAGTDANNTPLASNLKGTVALTANVESNFSATSLSMNTTYDLYVVADAGGGFIQASPAKVTATTYTYRDPVRFNVKRIASINERVLSSANVKNLYYNNFLMPFDSWHPLLVVYSETFGSVGGLGRIYSSRTVGIPTGGSAYWAYQNGLDWTDYTMKFTYKGQTGTPSQIWAVRQNSLGSANGYYVIHVQGSSFSASSWGTVTVNSAVTFVDNDVITTSIAGQGSATRLRIWQNTTLVYDVSNPNSPVSSGTIVVGLGNTTVNTTMYWNIDNLQVINDSHPVPFHVKRTATVSKRATLIGE